MISNIINLVIHLSFDVHLINTLLLLVLLLLLISPWPSLKGHKKVNIELHWDNDVENIPMKFRKDTCSP